MVQGFGGLMFGKTIKVKDPYHLYLRIFRERLIDVKNSKYDVPNEQGELAVILAVAHANVGKHYVREGDYPWSCTKFREYCIKHLINQDMTLVTDE
jgi:hypothetical protein